MRLVFESSYDIADVGGLELWIVEEGGASFAVALDSGLFLPVTDGASLLHGDFPDIIAPYESLAGRLTQELNAGSGGAVWSVTFDDATERFKFARSSAGGVTSVAIVPNVGGGLLGLTGPINGALSYEGQRAPDFVIASSVGFWTDYEAYEGGRDIAYDIEAHDGSPGGAAKDGAATYVDFTVPLEPVARVGNFPRLVDASAPWTWRDFWRHSRNVNPFVMRDDAGSKQALLLRADGAAFRPRRRGDNYIGHWDLAFQTRELAWV